MWSNHVWRAEHSERIIYVHLCLCCDVDELRSSVKPPHLNTTCCCSCCCCCYFSRGTKTSFTPELSLCRLTFTENTPGHTFDFCMFYISGTCFIICGTWQQTPAVRSINRWLSGPLLVDRYRYLAFQKAFVFLFFNRIGLKCVLNIQETLQHVFILIVVGEYLAVIRLKANEESVVFTLFATGLWFCSVSVWFCHIWKIFS